MIALTPKVRCLKIYCMPKKKKKSVEDKTSFEIAEARENSVRNSCLTLNQWEPC